MKRTLIVLLAAASLGLSAVAVAQDAGPSGGSPVQQGQKGKHKGNTAKSLKRLQAIWAAHKGVVAKMDLTPEQRKKIDELDRKTEQAMKDLQEKPGALDEKRDDLLKIQKDFHMSLNKIFTKDQQRKYRVELRDALKKGNQKQGTKDKDKPKDGGGS